MWNNKIKNDYKSFLQIFLVKLDLSKNTFTKNLKKFN